MCNVGQLVPERVPRRRCRQTSHPPQATWRPWPWLTTVMPEGGHCRGTSHCIIIIIIITTTTTTTTTITIISRRRVYSFKRYFSKLEHAAHYTNKEQKNRNLVLKNRNLVRTHTHTHTRTHARTHARTRARAHTHTHYSTTLLPNIKYTHDTFTPITKHYKIATTANKRPGKTSFINKYVRNPTDIKLCI